MGDMKTSILTTIIAAITLPAFAADPVPATPANPVTPVPPANPATPTVSDAAADGRFMEYATQVNWTTAKLADVAQSRAKRDDVKAFADTVEKAHESAQTSLKELMDKMDLKLPKDITPEQQAAINDLKAQKDEDFDRLFINRMVTDHKNAVSLYEQFIRDTKHAALKDYANVTVIHLKAHLARAEELAKVIGGVALK